jgi:hypothetical protein
VVVVVVPCTRPTSIAIDSGFRDGGTATRPSPCAKGKPIFATRVEQVDTHTDQDLYLQYQRKTSGTPGTRQVVLGSCLSEYFVLARIDVWTHACKLYPSTHMSTVDGGAQGTCGDNIDTCRWRYEVTHCCPGQDLHVCSMGSSIDKASTGLSLPNLRCRLLSRFERLRGVANFKPEACSPQVWMF